LFFPEIPKLGEFVSGHNPARVRQVCGIVKNSGPFEGNEQQGSFNVKDIKGHSNVTALVNVIIIDKPFGVPNSVI